MREIGTALGGVGLLIFAYLLLANSGSASTILSSFGNVFTSGVSVLQGRGGGGGSLGNLGSGLNLGNL